MKGVMKVDVLFQLVGLVIGVCLLYWGYVASDPHIIWAIVVGVILVLIFGGILLLELIHFIFDD